MRQALISAYQNNVRRRRWRRTTNPLTTPENEMVWDNGVLVAWDGVGSDVPVVVAWDS